MPKPHPIVFIARAAWRDLLAQVCGHQREGGGLLIGSHTRYGNFHVDRTIGMTHLQATKWRVFYTDEEQATARLAAYEAYKPLEPIGGWHSHIFPRSCRGALIPQISDDWTDSGSDVSDMLDGDIEIIAAVFPYPGYKLHSKEYVLHGQLGDVVCRAEPWLRVRHGKIVPCRIKVR